LSALSEFAADGLIELTGDAITVTDAGRLFIRNIAMCFDAHAQTGERRHSKTI
jgi:oxygen-independent coproporphyrinogen-3 oxidase